MSVDLYINGSKTGTFGLNGTLGEEKTDTILGWVADGENTLKLSFDSSLVEIKKVEIM